MTLRKFLALYLLIEIIQKLALSQYWSTDPLLQNSVFNHVMSRNRFQMILQFIHFADNTFSDSKDSNSDPLYKIRPIVEYLVDKFKSVYIPSKNISIDEELLLWKGRLIFKRYIPSKKAQIGIKMFSLCEDSGYLWNSFIYLGRNSESNPEEKELKRRIFKSGSVVISLIKELLGCGYSIYIDNWYTSQSLFEYLYEHDTVAPGTARKNRIDLQISFKKISMISEEIKIF